MRAAFIIGNMTLCKETSMPYEPKGAPTCVFRSHKPGWQANG